MGEKITFVTAKKKRGTVIIKNPIMVTEDIQIGNTKKSTRKRREVQYVSTLDSIYVDEQIKMMGSKPTPDPIYIAKGKRDIDGDDVALVKFLRIHSDNVENGGKDFRELDIEKEDLFEVKKFQKTSKICNEIMEADENLTYSIAVWFLGFKYMRMTPNKVKTALYTRCQNDFDFVEKVEGFIKDKNYEEKLTVTLAFTKDVLSIKDGNKITWSGSGETVFIGTQADDVVTDFATWLKVDKEGRENLKLIVDKLDRASKLED